MADFGLYDYQQEVVERALQGENIIICLPTGAGKTRAAVYVAKRHLETTANAKVVVLVNKVCRGANRRSRTHKASHVTGSLVSASPQVHLVDQHHSKEFQPHLSPDYRVAAISGGSDERDFFAQVLKDSDVVICTAQILYNAMISTEEAKYVELSGTKPEEISGALKLDFRLKFLRFAPHRYHAAHR